MRRKTLDPLYKAHPLRKIQNLSLHNFLLVVKRKKLKKHFNSFPSKTNIKLQTPRRETQTYNVIIMGLGFRVPRKNHSQMDPKAPPKL
jgi:hypothetical protein